MTTNTNKNPRTPRQKLTYKPAPLPAEGFCRKPSILAALGISSTSWENGRKSGKYPEGILLSPRTRVFPVAEIRALLASIEAKGAE